MESLLPNAHLHMLLDVQKPSLRWDGNENPRQWQERARKRLYDLLGIAEIEPNRTEANLIIDYDRIMEAEGYREIRFRFFSEKNVIVPAHLLIPLGAEKPLPAVICLQGHSKGMHVSLSRTRYKGETDTSADGDRNFAVRTVKEGWCAIALEQRCFGESGGTENGPDCRQAAMRALLLGRTLIGERVWDVRRLIDVLTEAFADTVDVNRIVCLGNSGGGTATVYAAALDTRIAMAVPSCAVCRYADSIGAMLHCECNYVPGIAKEFDMGDLCALIAPRPLVVVSGKNDPIFPLHGAKQCVEDGKRVYAAMNACDRITQVIGDGEHRFYADGAWEKMHPYFNL